MMRLVKVELGRLLSRRLFRITIAVGLLSIVLVDGVIAARSNTGIAAARARATQVEAQSYASCLQYASTNKTPGQGPTKAECEQDRPAAQAASCVAQLSQTSHITAADCARIKDEYVQDPRFHFASHAQDVLTGAAFILVTVGMVIGASLVGAEWQAGTFASLLTWEPRRQRVLAAKLLASVIGMVVLAGLLAPLLELGAWLAADLRGTTDGTTSQLVEQLAGQYGRLVGLVALVTLIGAALAATTRHTVAVVGIVGGYLVAGELVGSIVSTWWRNHALAAHLVAFVRGRYEFTVLTRTATGETSTQHALHAASGAVLVSVLAAVAVALATATLSRRDVA